jgi:hypothetical protein
MFMIIIKMNKKTINYKENENKNKNEFSDLYYRLYIDCIKYKTEKVQKEINCNYYYNKYSMTKLT